MTTRLLFVCTGNICRSPAAELLLAQLGSAPGAEIVASSAGTLAQPGMPIDARTGTVLESHGIDASGFTSRRLNAQLADEADLILTMTREQRSAVARLAPACARRTFTLNEFTEVLARAPIDVGEGDESPVPRLVAWAGAHRGSAVMRSLDVELDIPDPHGLPVAAHARAVEQIRSALVRALPRLAGTGS